MMKEKDTIGEWWKWRSKERKIIIERINLYTERERERLNDENGKKFIEMIKSVGYRDIKILVWKTKRN